MRPKRAGEAGKGEAGGSRDSAGGEEEEEECSRVLLPRREARGEVTGTGGDSTKTMGGLALRDSDWPKCDKLIIQTARRGDNPGGRARGSK